MRRIKQLILTLLCLSMVMTSAIGTAYADTAGYTVNAAAGQSEAALNDELYQQWADACNGKFSAEALKEFAVNLKNEYVPRVLYGIMQKFTFARPSAEGMKIGLELVYKDNSKAELASVTSNGKEYKLSIHRLRIGEGRSCGQQAGNVSGLFRKVGLLHPVYFLWRNV